MLNWFSGFTSDPRGGGGSDNQKQEICSQSKRFLLPQDLAEMVQTCSQVQVRNPADVPGYCVTPLGESFLYEECFCFGAAAHRLADRQQALIPRHQCNDVRTV